MAIDSAGNDLAAEEAFIVKMGLFNIWVCAPKSWDQEKVQAFINEKAAEGDINSGWVSGTQVGWVVKTRDHEDEGLVSPGKCGEDETRQHWNCHC